MKIRYEELKKEIKSKFIELLKIDEEKAMIFLGNLLMWAELGGNKRDAQDKNLTENI